jgi:hypothetical protein
VSASVRLERALSHMRPPLLTERARDRLLAFSALACPDGDVVFLEHRVSDDGADQVDVSVGAAAFGARAALTREVSRLAARDRARWGPTERALDRWCRRDSDEAGALGAAYLEYDLAPEGSANPAPSLFLRVVGLSSSHDQDGTRRALQRAITWIAPDGEAWLGESLDAVLRAVPDNFSVAHLGFMFARADETLRLELVLPSLAVGALLARLGWRGTFAGCREPLARAEQAGWLTLALGFAPAGLCDRLGIEFRPRSGESIEAWLAALVQSRWCTAAKAEALKVLLAERDEEYRAELSHAKFVVGERGIELKLYVVLSPRHIRFGRLAPLSQILARTRRAMPADRRCPFPSS